MKRALCLAVIAVAIVLPALAQQAPPAPPTLPKPVIAPTPPAPPTPPPPGYQKALEMINSGRYQAALAKLQALRSSPSYGDATLYWRAYAQSKLDRMQAALADLARLKSQYANSAWQPDAAALRMELEQANRELQASSATLRTLPALAGPWAAPAGVSGSDELKLLAINGLMQNDPKKALPLLEAVVAGPDSATVKQRALFVLAQSPDPGAVAAITRLAGNAANPALQREAIRDLAITGHADGLWTIYQQNPPLAAKREILQSMAVSGDVSRLIQLAHAETNPALQVDAVRALGMSSSPAAVRAIAAMYAGAHNRTLSETVLEAMFLHNDASGLVALARKETDPKLKQEIVARLSLMHNPAATAYLMEILSR